MIIVKCVFQFANLLFVGEIYESWYDWLPADAELEQQKKFTWNINTHRARELSVKCWKSNTLENTVDKQQRNYTQNYVHLFNLISNTSFQVVTLVLYTYFIAALVGRQMLPNPPGTTGTDNDLYFPLFTALQVSKMQSYNMQNIREIHVANIAVFLGSLTQNETETQIEIET